MEEIILRVLMGRAEPMEERRLSNWRAESTDNEQYFSEVAAVWGATEQRSTEEFVRTLPSPPAAEVIVRHGDALSRKDVRRRFARAVGRREIWPWAAAAAVATISLGFLIGRSGGGVDSLAGTEFIASGAEAMTVALSDGSFARLAPGSRVRFAGDADRREAWLTGRAFFGVAADAARPFIVHSPVGDTRVLGTRFEVSTGPDALRVIVVEGRVRVTSTGGRSAEVTKGQVVRITNGGEDFTVETVADVYQVLDWPGGILLFQGTPLPQVAEEVAAHFGVTIRLDDPELTTRTVTAWFGEEPLTEVIESICLLVQAGCGINGSDVVIGR